MISTHVIIQMEKNRPIHSKSLHCRQTLGPQVKCALSVARVSVNGSLFQSKICNNYFCQEFIYLHWCPAPNCHTKDKHCETSWNRRFRGVWQLFFNWAICCVVMAWKANFTTKASKCGWNDNAVKTRVTWKRCFRGVWHYFTNWPTFGL